MLGSKNLFGKIIYARGESKITVKLTSKLKGKKLTSDILELVPTNETETFKPLTQYYSVIINGALNFHSLHSFSSVFISINQSKICQNK